MLKNLKYNYVWVLSAVLCINIITAVAQTDTGDESGMDGCYGEYPDPIADVCWMCIFPIEIGPIKIEAGQPDPDDDPPPLICTCPAPPPVFYRIGIGISYWEPARVAEIVRQPMCSPTLDGTVLGDAEAARGNNVEPDDESGQAFYQVHYMLYPLLNWLGLVVTEGICSISESFDFVYMSELDPLWDDDELSFVLNPEAALFTSVVSQAACVADSVKAAITGFGFDELFGGIATNTATQYQQVSTNALGSVSTINPNDIGKSGLATGVSTSMEKLSDYYMERVNEMYPIIEIASKRIGELVLQDGVDLNRNIVGNMGGDS